MTVIGIDKVQALLRLSQIDELYLFDVLDRENPTKKVKILGIDSDHVVVSLKETNMSFIIPTDQFRGRYRGFLFMADDVWNDVFEDL